MKFDLESIEANPCVYISKSKPPLIVTLFVDGGLAICSSPARLGNLVHYMEEHFTITRSSVDLYVDLHILRLKTKGHIFIYQAV